jgi:hypothetical protein
VVTPPAPLSPPHGVVARWLRLSLPKLYLQRFPLLLGAMLLGYVPFALLAVPAMFRSTLVLTPTGLTFVTLFACVSAAVVMVTRRAVALCGPERFNIPWRRADTELNAWTVVAHMSLAAPISVVSAWMSALEGELGFGRALAYAATGAAGAAVFMVLVSIVHALLVDAAQELPEMILPRHTSRRLLEPLHRRKFLDLWPDVLGRRLIRWARPYLGPGYFDAAGRILPAHLYAIGTCLTFGGFYLGAYFLGKPEENNGIPALVFLLILATFATIVLSGVAFLLDRHHLPTLLPLAIWIALLAIVSTSDHYFPVHRATGPLSPPTPAEIAATREPLLTVVAVDGGGIQAAAWAATVLTGVEERWNGFHKSVRFVSAVSGGSVGTMYFLAALRPDRAPSTQELAGVRQAAMRGSLGEAAWGLAYPDLWRALVPIVFYRFEKDRGWAMEQAWRRNFDKRAIPTLGDWTAAARAGWMPSMALNATGVESGQRFAFATFAPPAGWQLGTVAERYPGFDVEVPTAARVSAAFPYVTPIAAARPEPGIADRSHYADGGYYDNTGMGIAMRWLDDALQAHAGALECHAVAFVRIRSSSTTGVTARKERAWAYEAIGPFVTLLSVRTAGQRERAETELEFLRRFWSGRKVDIRSFEFAFDLPTDPPLSWQLTPREARDLERAWNTDANKRELERYLTVDPRQTGCK